MTLHHFLLKMYISQVVKSRQGMSNVKFLCIVEEIVRFSAVNIPWGLLVLLCHYS